MSRLPLIGLTACSDQVGLQGCHTRGDPFVRAVESTAQSVPLIIFSLAQRFEPSVILDSTDGLLFTGAPSHAEQPVHGGPASAPGTAHDCERYLITLRRTRTCCRWTRVTFWRALSRRKRAKQRDSDALINT
ncbi:putative glutamine amidotransferase [Pseudomonas asplenii]|uniref:Putative glutamine amidotransferase n=1 Tax=Pseudomonas asplenii TaxID=53407 RepID=A0A1H1R9C2_9PSED|nr:gamma-glutamyl-gamma-aminobutyrate hydrolase family protein [Pseudomonas asplenii]SDS32265.1 putative glutamine amidotransferase [Pseudomonas asplenii]